MLHSDKEHFPPHMGASEVALRERSEQSEGKGLLMQENENWCDYW
jgi:hypothetical protein